MSKPKSLFIYFLLVPAYLFSINTNAQSGQVSGIVMTSDSQPAEGVNVQVKETRQIVVTAKNGSYQLTNLGMGKYTLVVSFAGLQTIQRPIEISGSNTEQNFVLQENRTELKEIIIHASKSLNEKSASIGKMNIKALDLPQSFVSINREILERQQVLHISDVLQNVNGVYISGTTGGFQEEIAARGFALGSSNTFKNGVRFNNAVMPELSSVEKVEFLKGGSAILFGNVTAGGIMNIVTKKPRFEQGGQLSFRTGSFDFYKPAIDVYGSLNKKETSAYRFNAGYEKAGSFRDRVNSERIYFNPSLLLKIGRKTEWLIETDFLSDNRTPDYGTGAINYEIAELPRNYFLGVNWGYNKVKQSTATSTITHHINSNWQLKATTGYQDYNSDLFAAARPNSNSIFVQTNGTWIRGLQKTKNEEKYWLAQVDLTGKIKTGKLEHLLLAGADADRYITKASTFQTTTYNNALANQSIRGKNIYDTINIFNPYGSAFSKRNDIPYLAPNLLTTSPINRAGIYVQDLVSIMSKVKLLAGLRFSIQQNEKATVDTLAKTTKGYITAYKTAAFSPRVGLVYQPLKTVSIFTSYTNNFSPNSGVDINNAPLKPSVIDQFELGIKTDLIKSLLSVNITAYRIINSDFVLSVLNPPAAVPAAKELVGEVTSKGIEVDMSTKSIHGISVIGGYSYNDTRYTKSNNSVSSVKAGDRLRYNPSHTSNINLFYAFPSAGKFSGCSLGAGVNYIGKRVAGRNPTAANPTFKLMPVPDYTLFDISAGYTGGKYTVRFKLSNLFNQLSYNVHDDNSVNPVAPRQFSATIAYKL